MREFAIVERVDSAAVLVHSPMLQDRIISDKIFFTENLVEARP